MDFLRDPLWQFIGALLTAVSIVITIALSVIIYQLQRKRKDFTYEVLSNLPILQVEREAQGRVEILFDGKPVSDTHMVIIRLSNPGNVPILPLDFQGPVKIHFGKKTQILSAEVIKLDHQSQATTIKIKSPAIALSPVLLNGKDSITIKALLSGFEGNITVEGRIAGISKISTHVDNPLSGYVWRASILIAFISFLYYLFKGAGTSFSMNNVFLVGLTYGFIGAGVLGFIFSQFREAQTQMDKQNQTLKFSDGEQPRLTPINIIRNSRWASIGCAFWAILMIVVGYVIYHYAVVINGIFQ